MSLIRVLWLDLEVLVASYALRFPSKYALTCRSSLVQLLCGFGKGAEVFAALVCSLFSPNGLGPHFHITRSKRH